MFKKPFSFKGRIRRTEFGISFLIAAFTIPLCNVVAYLSIKSGSPQASNSDVVYFIFLAWIPLFWFLWAQGAKRCHDRGNSGWYQIIPFYVLWMLFANSENGLNEYGLNPKGIGNPPTESTS
jgi:uncharacterized membrane protein YhaH (DUF805 family)